jgi:hypothetical protein
MDNVRETGGNGKWEAQGYTALTRSAFVESGLDLDSLARTVKDEIVSPECGDVVIWAGTTVAGVVFANGGVLKFHQLTTGSTDRLRAAVEALAANKPAVAREELANAGLSSHPSATVRLILLSLDLVERGKSHLIPGLIDHLRAEIGDLRPGHRPCPRAPGAWPDRLK